MNSEPPIEQQIAAGATLARSALVGTIAKWACAVCIPALLSWVAAKLDTSQDTARDIRDLRTDVQKLTAQQGELLKRVDESVPQMQRRLTGVQRDVVVATGAAIAYETEARSKQKLAAGEELAKSFDGRIERAMEAAAAADSVIHNVAVPHAR